MVTNHKIEKVTFNIPSELKEQLNILKEEMKVSLSTIYNNALSEYIKKQELEKWKNGVNMALNDSEYLAVSKELGSDHGDIYEY